MRIAAAAVVVVFLALVGAGLVAGSAARTVAASPLLIVVTSAADTVATPVCPDASRCTLRKAIETANLDLAATAVTITFSATIFPAATPATITIGGTPLPFATHPDLAIDGSGVGVRIAGAPAGAPDGLVLTGAAAAGFGPQAPVARAVVCAGRQRVAEGAPRDPDGIAQQGTRCTRSQQGNELRR